MRICCLNFLLVLLTLLSSAAQNPTKERSFSLPSPTLQAMLKKLPGGTAGPLPTLEGFVVPGTHALDHYHRPYYECSVRITPTSSAESLVRVTAKITAWNDDERHSGYEVLESNGRIEADLLERLQGVINSKSANKGPSPGAAKSESAKLDTAKPEDTKRTVSANSKAEPTPEISAPVRQLPSLRELHPPMSSSAPVANPALAQEAKNLEDILRNQSHPTNLVAVKQEHTAVLQNPRTDGTVLFVADAQDEFEVLEQNPDWVYVRISGISRGWIRRSNVEAIDGSDRVNRQPTVANDSSRNSPLFTVSSEELGNFPGKWTPLKDKPVRIISVQQTAGTAQIRPEDKMHFAETEFKRETQALPASAGGMVLIFDAEDGGMVAATRASLEQWKNGAISDQAFWTQCYFDPPDIFGSSSQ